MGVSPSAPREETHAPARSRMLLVILAYAGNGEAEDCVELGLLAHGSPLREGGVFWPLLGRPRFRGATLRRGPSLIHPPPRVVGRARQA